MKVKLRRGCQSDLEQVYQLHTKCFSISDCWYKSTIKHYLDKSIILEINNNDSKKKIIGVLLQGSITACNLKIIDENTNQINAFDNSNNLNDFNDGYKEDVFEPITSNGKLFLLNNLHLKDLYGIVMICIDPKFRGKKLSKKQKEVSSFQN